MITEDVRAYDKVLISAGIAPVPILHGALVRGAWTFHTELLPTGFDDILPDEIDLTLRHIA